MDITNLKKNSPGFLYLTIENGYWTEVRKRYRRS